MTKLKEISTPFMLASVGKEYLWGGDQLKKEWNKNFDLSPLAESWECSVHPDGISKVRTGFFSGMTLDHVIRQHPEFVGSHAACTTNSLLPILVKLIDAKQNLSVQVHPDDAFSLKYEKQLGKTEMWYVLDAKPGAELVLGFNHDMTLQEVKKAIENQSLMEHLNRVPVHKGDVFYIPAGMIHGIGAGVLIAEVQENSNVTYRVYDYNRVDKHGKTRELHIDQAIAVMNDQRMVYCRQPRRFIRYQPGYTSEFLCRCRYFQVEKLTISRMAEFIVGKYSFQILLCVDGKGILKNPEGQKILDFQKGDCIFTPSNTGKWILEGKSEILKVGC